MTVKLFVLGLPGSGKSTVARYIAAHLEDKGWKNTRFSDHVILQEMFLADTEHKQFRAADHGGFDVIDLTVFDMALQRLEQEVNNLISSSALPEELLLIEFARNYYQGAFQQFSHEFLQDAHFLYLNVNTEICKRRILERIANPSSEDDFFVSEYIFNTYYNKGNEQSIPQILEKDYGIDKRRVKVIENNGSLDDIAAVINEFVDTIHGL
jgi:adenylate kinase family enzyme